MIHRRAFLLGLWLIAARAAQAGDVYVVRFTSQGGSFRDVSDCTNREWQDQLVFHNSGSNDESIGLLGVSNGAPNANPQELTVPAGLTRLSNPLHPSAIDTWAPDPSPPLWVAHLEVPDGVSITSRARVLTIEFLCSHPQLGSINRVYAGLPLPVVRSLTPASVPQVHMATDIGGVVGGATPKSDSRINVGVYNGGAATAAVSIDVHRACDDAVLSQLSLSIPPNTIIQNAGLTVTSESCSEHLPALDTYVVVTADQPSFSYVVTLSNQSPPLFPATSSP